MREIDPVGDSSRVIYFWAKYEILGLEMMDHDNAQKRDRLWRSIKEVELWM